MTAGPTPLLAFNGGYVDTLGFLSLHGLFTAHVTGNFVTIGAAAALGTSGIATKLLALPVFAGVIIICRLAGGSAAGGRTAHRRGLLLAEIALLGLAAVFAAAFGPFADGDTPTAMLTGLTLVAAMAIQNALHRIHMASEAPTTLMTGSTTQALIDFVDFGRGVPLEARSSLVGRLKRLFGSLASFALGCGAAAAAYASIGTAGFAIAPVVAFLAWLVVEAELRNVRPDRAT